jgi:hypothetical protein
VVLGQVDLEQLIEEKFNSAADWEAALKMIKAKGRDAERLPRYCTCSHFLLLIISLTAKSVLYKKHRNPRILDVQ